MEDTEMKDVEGDNFLENPAKTSSEPTFEQVV